MNEFLNSHNVLSEDEVARLRRRWHRQTAKQVQESGLPEFLDRLEISSGNPVAKKALLSYARKALRFNRANELQQPHEDAGAWMASLAHKNNIWNRRGLAGEDSVIKDLAIDLDPLKWSGGAIRKAAAERQEPASVVNAFGDKKRLYVRLTGHSIGSVTENTIAEYLAKKGYAVLDYNEGVATDERGKQRYRIGKLLKENPMLSREFDNDITRSKATFLVVISRAPFDIARVSAGRAWTSCINPKSAGSRFERIFDDIRQGSLVAYLIKESDPEIRRPLARVLIKPYRSQDTGERMYVPDKIYGLATKAFGDFVADFTEQSLNDSAKSERYYISPGLYPETADRRFIDRDGNKKTYVPLDHIPAKQFLLHLGLDVREDSQGNLRVHDLDLSGMTMNKLPDLRKVTVSGNLTLSANHLTSLYG